MEPCSFVAGLRHGVSVFMIFYFKHTVFYIDMNFMTRFFQKITSDVMYIAKFLGTKNEIISLYAIS